MSFLILKSHHIFFQKMQFRIEKNPHTDNAVCRSERVKEALKEVNDIPRTTTISYSSTTPWNSTGFYYSPRYPQSHRGMNKLSQYRILAGKFKCFIFQGQPRPTTTTLTREGTLTTLTITILTPTSQTTFGKSRENQFFFNQHGFSTIFQKQAWSFFIVASCMK